VVDSQWASAVPLPAITALGAQDRSTLCSWVRSVDVTEARRRLFNPGQCRFVMSPESAMKFG